MMWDWESVREEACRLYLEDDLPLEQIEAFLKDRDFLARANLLNASQEKTYG